MKKLILTLWLITSLSLVLYAQKKISGKVISASDGMGIPSVSVTLKNDATVGTSTDIDGNYTLTVPSENSILVFSSIGMTTVELPANKAANVVLKEDTQMLDEVVITALGIKKEEKTLTYAQQKVGADEISKTKDINFASSLTGKTAGVNLQKSSSGAGGSTRIVLRGNKSIVGVSSPLFVIDGIPIFSDVPNANSDSFFDNRDKSDALSQINPEDIESITVLKGSNAAILYGSQGANGVVMITTKKGKEGKLSGSFSSSLIFENAIELPKMQYRYGSLNNDESWATTKGNYDDSFIDDFFDTGINIINSINITGGTDKNNSYLSYANTIVNGIIPNNKYTKHNLTINQNNKYLDDKLTIGAKVMLTDEKINNRPKGGYYFNPLTGLYLFPRSLNMADYKNNYQVLDPNRNIMTQNWHILNVDKQQNPYWIINKDNTEDRVKRMISSLNASYKFNDNLTLSVRGNYDYMTSVYDARIAAGATSVLAHPNGRWRYEDVKSTQLYTDAILSYNKSFGDFDFTGIIGGVYEKKEIRDGYSFDSDQFGLKYANEYNFQNLDKDVHVINSIDSRSEKQGLFGNVQLGYQNKVYADISARNDWSSTLSYTDNTSYFYPSFGLTTLLDKIFEMPSYVNLAKLRASYAMISNDVPAFITHPINKIDRNGVKVNTTKPFTEMKPEEQRSFEVGLDVRLFGSRLGFDITYYNINTKNQFLNLTAPSGSGHTTYYVNAGHIENHGLEATIIGKPIETSDWNWNTTLNFSYNKNEVISLHPELKGKYQLNKTEGYALYITEGGSFGDIYVYKFIRDEQDRIKIDDKGKPMRSNDLEFIGNAQPDFLMGWNNNISYKNWSLSFLIDGKFGGKAVNLTESQLDAYGVSERSAEARDAGGVQINGVDANGNPVNSIDPQTFYKAVGGRDGIIENYVYDATNVRLRQLAISYNFNLAKHSNFFKNANLSFIANNLFFIYKDAPFDPDLSMSTGNKMQSVSLFTVPSTRSYGLSLKLNF